ncbi:uncharacterized protein LOC121769724 [Salvia splendens]|uniref:uncharacterized protein LOC121769724 n=1 Tax=Salvia splendens TaxID=180675 RepID=UPI001C27CAB7|nr:uncharacterized protein LOC121769724 [Salvia splendens]XP_042022397.1 uncharacterized protein LOC121769724 [Salvia splendens]XP_042022399.1 uncharacterized protein LOC121769724 [Salvia splendens]
MGTKIQANPFLREKYHAVIDLDASTNNAMRSSYNEIVMLQNGKNPESISSYDIQKVKQTILEHESVFRNQLGELHRLYGRQRELMTEIKRREMNKTDVMEEKFRSSYLLSPFPTENMKRSWNPSNNTIFRGGTYSLGFQERFSKFPAVQKRNHLAACDGDDRLYLRGVQTSQHGAGALSFSLYDRNGYQPGDERITNPRNGVSDRLALSRAEISENPCSSLNLVTKDFFHDDRMSKEGSVSIHGLRNERSGPDYFAVNPPEKWRIDKRSLSGELGSGKSVAFPQSLLAEPIKEFSNSTSLSRRKKKIFGVEISEGNDDAFDSVPNMSSNLDHRVRTSLIADSFVQNLSLHGENQNEGNHERSKAESKGGTWLQKAMNMAAEGEQKPREAIPQSPFLADCERNQDNNPKGSLPWFLRDSKVSTDFNDKAKGCYFMNLDSLQSRSHKFFAKVEKPDDALQTSKQEKEVEGENLKHCIDLNMSLDEEGAPSAPSLPCAIVKIATTEIDLEAPAALESEVDALDSSESDKFAAEAMIAISSSVDEKLVDESFSSLKWFAQVVSSEHVATNQSRTGQVEESIPDGMDQFEFMTLKLEDSKEEYRHYEPFVLQAPSDDDTGASLTRRTRRGQSRRGRQRRDFQRDILPSLVTLSRLQVTEDFQAFDELLKAGGATRQSHSTRNGRGKKRLASSPRVKTPCSRQAEQPVCQIEERSLAGWGKKTRRLPRQRCPNAFLSFPVKC